MHKNGKEQYTIIVEDEGGEVKYSGLPDQFAGELEKFSAEERRADPLLVLQSIIREVPDDEESEYPPFVPIDPSTLFKKDDPSKYYDIVKRIGVGGFAKVFEVKRRSDGYKCALKFIELTGGEKDRKIINNEVALMLQCQENDGVLRCIECFDFRNRLWIFLELMDGGALTNMLEELSGGVSEKFCRYVSYKVLQGLKYLHDRHILHRDIKSDNILFSEQGDIKLADFGYAI